MSRADPARRDAALDIDDPPLLADAKIKPIERSKRPKQPERYDRPTAGDRAQIGSTKVAEGMTQSTAVDDCTRMRVLGLHPDKMGTSTASSSEGRAYMDRGER